MFKKSKSNTTSYGIVGIGRFGYALAIELAKEGNDILIIDCDEEKVAEHNNRYVHKVVRNQYRCQEAF